MAVIKVAVEINAALKTVWNVVSDLDSEPKYWKGTKSVKNISNENNILRREIIIAFKDKKCMQEITMTPMESIEINFTEGIIKGNKIITLSESNDKVKLTATWDIALTGMMNMFTGILKGHIRGGTEQALEAIKKDIEGNS